MKSLLIGIIELSSTDTERMVQYLKLAEACLSINFEFYTISSDNFLLNSCFPAFDIIFLNLPIPNIDSKILLQRLRQRDAHVSIILTSETSDLYPLGYEFSVKNYFVKPLSYSKILEEIKRSLVDETLLSQPYVWISNQHGDYKLFFNKLRYIETSSRKLVLHYGNEQIYYNGQLNDFEKKLPINFFRCNNSYIVNINYIEQIQQDISRYSIILITGEQIPLSRNKKGNLKKIIHFLEQ